MKCRIDGVIIRKLNSFEDKRGVLTEVWRSDEVDLIPAMSYVSFTKPNIARGPHEHRYQIDMFIFIDGHYELHLWSQDRKIHEKFDVGHDNKVMVVVPPGVIHGYKNVGDRDAFVINMANRLYKGPSKADPAVDEIRHEDGGIYIID